MGSTQSNNLAQSPDNVPISDKDTGKVNFIWNQWFTNVQIKLNTITAAIIALSKNATAGFLSSDGAGGIFSRTLTAGTGITITNPTGALGNPIISASGGAGGSPMHVTTNITTSYTAQLTDAPASTANVGWIDSQNSLSNTINIDTNANVAFPIGTDIYVCQGGLGQTTIKALAGVTLNGPTITPAGQYGVGRAVQVAANSWRIFGNLAFQIYTTYTTAVLADNPILFYLLNDTSGTTATNLGSLAGANATYTGGYTQNVASGNIGIPTCVTLNGTSGYLVTPSIAPLGSATGISLEIWINPSASPSVVRLTDIYNRLSIALNSNDPQVIFNGSANLSSGYVVPTSGTKLVQLVYTAGPSGEVWYINGTSVATSATAFINANPTAAYYIGQYSSGGYFYPGNVAAHSMYQSVLSPARVLAHYNAGA